AGAPAGALPVIDAQRREVFTLRDGVPVAIRPAELELESGRVLIGDGALRYRTQFEAVGAEIPPDDDLVHLPRARFHALCMAELADADRVEPIYVRLPDAEKAAA